ncbi:uncharacterized protein WM277_023968 [Molossus nigricans]
MISFFIIQIAKDEKEWLERWIAGAVWDLLVWVLAFIQKGHAVKLQPRALQSTLVCDPAEQLGLQVLVPWALLNEHPTLETVSESASWRTKLLQTNNPSASSEILKFSVQMFQNPDGL